MGRSPTLAGAKRRSLLRIAALLANVLLVACGSEPALSGAPPPPSNSDTPSAAALYSSTNFVVPFDVSPPEGSDTRPSVDTPHYVTWEKAGTAPLRILAPVSVYQPGAKSDTAPPRDYLTYLLDQERYGAHFTDKATTTVSGQPATLLTGTTDRSLDGSLGAPSSARQRRNASASNPTSPSASP